MTRSRHSLLVVLGSLVCASAAAHKPSDSYLRLGEPVERDGALLLPLRWDVALRDLDRALAIDANRDGKITWGEVRAAERSTSALFTSKLSLERGGVPCRIALDARAGAKIVRHSDGGYLVRELVLTCGGNGSALTMDYSLLFDLDPQHRGLLRTTVGTDQQITIFSRDQRRQPIALPAARGRDLPLWAAIRQGIHHIWTGYDHLLFLLALLLPSVLRRDGGRWLPVARLPVALVDVLKVVTAFTAAHSVTLSLAALGVLSLPSRIVESAIAASVVLAALNNLVPVVRADRWLVAFALGLLHGFGFSSTLADLGLDSARLLPTLVGFNLGVELGQSALVALFVPLAFLVRRSGPYRWGALQLGSVVISVVAAIWLYERAFNVLVISG